MKKAEHSSITIPASDDLVEISVFGWDISRKSKNFQILCLAAVVLTSFCLFAYMQELFYTLKGAKEHTYVGALLQCGMYGLLATIQHTVTRQHSTHIPTLDLILLGVLTAVSLGCTMASLAYVNYPTQVITKSCKLVPVMIGGILIQKKKYGLLDFFATFLMCTGLCFFILTDTQIVPNFNILGIFLLSTALICDAIVGNVQELVMRTYRSSSIEIVAYSYGIAFFVFLLGTTTTGNLPTVISFYYQDPMRTFGYGFMYTFAGFLGIESVVTLIRAGGVVAAVTVTTVRKALTMTLSFLLISKPFSFQYVWSGLLVIIGIYLNIFKKRKI